MKNVSGYIPERSHFNWTYDSYVDQCGILLNNDSSIIPESTNSISVAELDTIWLNASKHMKGKEMAVKNKSNYVKARLILLYRNGLSII